MGKRQYYALALNEERGVRALKKQEKFGAFSKIFGGHEN